jgi:hypothetical protein
MIALLKRTRDGAGNGHVGTAMNRRTRYVRDNGFHTNVTQLVRGGIESLSRSTFSVPRLLRSWPIDAMNVHIKSLKLLSMLR